MNNFSFKKCPEFEISIANKQLRVGVRRAACRHKLPAVEANRQVYTVVVIRVSVDGDQ